MQSKNYRLIPSARRKKIALRIAADGILELLTPPFITDAMADAIIAANSNLIRQLRQRAALHQKLDFSNGSKFLLLGELFELRHTHRLRLFDDAFLIPRGSDEEMRSSMICLYRELALSIIRKRLAIWQEKCGSAPQKIRITSANTRWGSCTSQGVISFSWKLIQTPLSCVDYVIVHELSHLKEMNHSALFWRHVANIMPDHLSRRQMLKKLARTLPHWE